MKFVALLLVLVLCGCAEAQQILAPVKSNNSGSAELLLQACPNPQSMKETEDALIHLINKLQAAGVMVNGNGGTSKLTIDLCKQ